MRGRGRGFRCLALAALLLVSVVAGAQEGEGVNECKKEGYLNNAQVKAQMTEAIEQRSQIRVETTYADLPRTSPDARQIAAPAAIADGPGVVDGPGFPDLVALAFSDDVLGRSDGVLTLNLGLLLLKGVQPAGGGDGSLTSPEGLLQHLLRKTALTLSTGGRGLEVDRDGDGTRDEALLARDADDVVGWEARFRVFGDRDRQSLDNWTDFLEETDGPARAADAAFNRLLEALRKDLENRGEPHDWIDEKGCVSASFVQSFLDREAETLWVWALADQTVNDVAFHYLEEVDREPVLSLFVGGTEREPDFGPDELRAGARFQFGVVEGKRSDLTLNLSWTRRDGLPGLDDAESWRLAVGQTWLIGRGETGQDRTGFDLTLAGSYEIFDDVPGARHDDVAKLNLTLDYPLTEKISLPISVTWANHADLLEEDDELSAHVGFTLGFQDLLRPNKGER